MPLRSLAARLLRSLPFVIHRATSPLGRPPLRDTPPATTGAPRRILAIKLDAIGDLLMTTPALRALRKAFPDAEIHLLAQPHVARLARLVPGPDLVEPLACGFWLSGGRRLSRAWEWIARARTLRRRQYDLVIDFTSLFHSAALAWATGAPLRLGLRRRIPLGFFTTEGFGHFFTHEFTADEDRHLADCMGLLATAVGAPADEGGWELHVPAEAREAAARLLDRLGHRPGENPLVVVHPGAKWPPKQWHARAFAGAIDLLQERGWRVVLVGGPRDGVLVETIRHACRLAPGVAWPPETIETLAGLLEHADAFLGNDSGPMHLAAAVGTPVVAAFGPTRPGRCGPRGSGPVIHLDAALACSPCPLYFTRDRCHRGHNYCMDGITTEEAASSVERCFSGQNGRGGR